MQTVKRKRFSDIMDKQRILSKTHGVCAMCGKALTLQSMTVDHYIPVSKGGPNRFDNLLPTCEKCNRRKGSAIQDWDKVYPYLSYAYTDALNSLYNSYMNRYEKALKAETIELSRKLQRRLDRYYEGMEIHTSAVRFRPEFQLVQRVGFVESYVTADKRFVCEFEIGELMTQLKSNLEERCEDDMETQHRISVGDLVLHFKHELDYDDALSQYIYIVKDIALHTETNEQLIIYQNAATHEIFARPLDMFLSEVDKEKYPDIKQQYRFEKWA